MRPFKWLKGLCEALEVAIYGCTRPLKWLSDIVSGPQKGYAKLHRPPLQATQSYLGSLKGLCKAIGSYVRPLKTEASLTGGLLLEGKG